MPKVPHWHVFHVASQFPRNQLPVVVEPRALNGRLHHHKILKHFVGVEGSEADAPTRIEGGVRQFLTEK